MRDERYGTRVSFITHKERVSLIAAQETADTSTAYGCRASLLREERLARRSHAALARMRDDEERLPPRVPSRVAGRASSTQATSTARGGLGKYFKLSLIKHADQLQAPAQREACGLELQTRGLRDRRRHRHPHARPRRRVRGTRCTAGGRGCPRGGAQRLGDGAPDRSPREQGGCPLERKRCRGRPASICELH